MSDALNRTFQSDCRDCQSDLSVTFRTANTQGIHFRCPDCGRTNWMTTKKEDVTHG